MNPKLPTFREAVVEGSNHPGEFWEIAVFKNPEISRKTPPENHFFSSDEGLRAGAESHIRYVEKVLLKILQNLLENICTGVSFI